MIYDIDKNNLPYLKIKRITDLFLSEHTECKIPFSIKESGGKNNAIGYFDPKDIELGLSIKEIKNAIKSNPAESRYYKWSWPKNLKIKISLASFLIHELYHYRQFCKKELEFDSQYNVAVFKKQQVYIPRFYDLEEYWNLPWEKDANENMAEFMNKYRNELYTINRLSNG